MLIETKVRVWLDLNKESAADFARRVLAVRTHIEQTPSCSVGFTKYVIRFSNLTDLESHYINIHHGTRKGKEVWIAAFYFYGPNDNKEIRKYFAKDKRRSTKQYDSLFHALYDLGLRIKDYQINRLGGEIKDENLCNSDNLSIGGS